MATKKKTGRVEGGVNNQTFALLMSRFDTIEQQNTAQLELLAKHIEKDDKVHAVVERHSTYWKIVTYGLPAVGGALLAKFGLKS